MKIKRLYWFDSAMLTLKPVSKPKQFLYENVFSICALIILAISALWIRSSIEYDERILYMEKEIEELKLHLEKQEDADTLHIRISQATLDGIKGIPFNDSIVFNYIKSCKAWYPEIIMAQYKIESASGASDLAVNANNFFGMRPVQGKRKSYTTQRHGDSYNGYAVYDNWKLSILDKILWEHFRFNEDKPDIETYLKAHANYAEDEEYIKKIKQVAKKYREQIK